MPAALLDYRDFDNPLDALLDAPHWYVGFSGGVDSTVLLHLLHQWHSAHASAPGLTALHINHGLQAGAGEWQSHCEVRCRALGLPIRSISVDVPAPGEAAAREARYAAFTRELQAGEVLFLGHHLDDQVETFFLRLMRGAGVEGLAAMPRQRALGAGSLVRPLLNYPRDELEAYAARHRLDYVEDPSNRDTGMDRNFLRREVMPLLASRWPAYRQSVARASAHLASAARTLDAVPATVCSVMGDPGLVLAPLVAGPVEAAASGLRSWLRARECRAPDSAALLEFLRQLREGADDGRQQLNCGDYRLQRYRDAVFLLPTATVAAPRQALGLLPGQSLEIPGVGVVSLKHAEGEGWQLEEGEGLTLRWREGGERCRLPGRSGSHSLKTLLQDLHVPPWWRERVPLVYLRDELLAVGDLLRCETPRWSAPAPPGAPRWCVAWERVDGSGSD